MASIALSSSYSFGRINLPMHEFGIIISCGDEAIIKTFKEGYIMFLFYSMSSEYTVEIVIQAFQSSTMMLVACKNFL